MMELLLDEEDYINIITQLQEAAAEQGLEIDDSSKKIVEIATTFMLTKGIPDKTFVNLARLIYNVGYRDNHFKSPIIH
jgi:methionine salvage enolase-phosphatase E1